MDRDLSTHRLARTPDNGYPEVRLWEGRISVGLAADCGRMTSKPETDAQPRFAYLSGLCWEGRDLTRLPLIERQALLKSMVVVKDERIRTCDYVEAAPNGLLSAVREQRLEGIIGKQRDSRYQPGKRSCAWIKHRVNRGQAQ